MRNKLKRRWTLLLLSALAVMMTIPAGAKEITYKDFAYALVLETPDTISIGQLVIPDRVYSQVYDQDLGDIRVYNGEDKVVQHVILSSKEEKESLETVHTVQFYPLYNDKQKLSALSSQISVNKNGVIVKVDDQKVSEDKGVKGYVIDISELEDTLDAIRIDWTWLGEKKSGIVKFDIMASNDLKNWTTMQRQATLLELRQGDAAIKRNRIELPKGKKYDYLYLDWSGLGKKLTVNKVTASTFKIIPVDKTKWQTARFNRIKDNAALFTNHSYAKTDQLNVRLPGENMVISAVVYGKVNHKDKWTKIYSGLFYRIRDGEEELSNDPVSIRRGKYRFFKVEPKETMGETDLGALELTLGFKPDLLLFMANGPAPYKVAFGQSRIKPVETSVERFLNQFDDKEKEKMITDVTVKDRVTLAGEKALEPPLLPTDWKQWLVWLIYLVVVALLAKMVWSLVKEMNKKK